MIPILKLLDSPPPSASPRLTFAPMAWLKLQYFCHAGDTEVGGFGIAAADDLLYIEDFVSVRQEASRVNVRLQDDAVADFFDGCVDRGLKPAQFSRIWIHTHPGTSATPSRLDLATFERCFGVCDWSLLFILARGGQTHARLSFRAGPGGQLVLPTTVDWSAWPGCLCEKASGFAPLFSGWLTEYAANVFVLPGAFEESLRGLGLECAGDDRWEIVEFPYKEPIRAQPNPKSS